MAKKKATKKIQLPDPELLFRKPMIHQNYPKYSDALFKWTESKLGVKLPKSYIELLKKRNGGYLHQRCYVCDLKTYLGSDNLIPVFEELPGLGIENDDSIYGRATLAHHEWGVPDGLVGLDGSHSWLCLDYRECGSEGEPSVVQFFVSDFEDEEGHFEFLADSFEQFVSGLTYTSLTDFIFAIDDPQITQETLNLKLSQLGCKNSNPWSWDEFKGASVPHAKIFLETNGTVQPDYDSRPLQHPLIRISVHKDDQNKCIKKLKKEFGKTITLICHPAERPVIKEVPEVKSPLSPAVEKEFESSMMHFNDTLYNAVYRNDRKSVLRLLKNGANPNKQIPGALSGNSIDIALNYGFWSLLKVLLKNSSKTPSQLQLQRVIHAQHFPAIKALTEKGAKLTPQHLLVAVETGNIKIVSYLLEQGLKPSPNVMREATDPKPNKRILKLLVEAGGKAPNKKIQKIIDAL